MNRQLVAVALSGALTLAVAGLAAFRLLRGAGSGPTAHGPAAGAAPAAAAAPAPRPPAPPSLRERRLLRRLDAHPPLDFPASSWPRFVEVEPPPGPEPLPPAPPSRAPPRARTDGERGR